MQKSTAYKIILSISILLSLSIGYFFLKNNNEEKKQVPVSDALALKVRPIIPQTATVSKNYIGYVVPINQVDVVAYISGFIDGIYVESGHDIAQNQPLVHIKPDEYIAQKAAAGAAVTQAKAAMKNAKTYYERITKAGDSVVSKTDIDNAEASFLEAKASFEKAGADFLLSEVNLGYTDIRSSISGMSGYIDLSIGDYVAPGKSLFSIIQYDPIRVVFSISDKDYLDEQNNKAPFSDEKIKLKLADNRIYETEGKYVFNDNKMNKATNSIAVYADFSNPQKTLMVDSYVNVIVEKELKDVILIDKKLVALKENGSFVFVVRDDEIKSVKVDILGNDNENYVIRNNFEKGDLLLLEDVGNISSGTKIKTTYSKV